MNILITGSNGFVGQNLIRYYKEHHLDDSLFVWDRSYGKLNAENFIKHYGPDVVIDKVIHLASSNQIIESWELPYKYIIENLELTLDALEFCKINTSGMIYISSYLYGNTQNLPINEKESLQVTSPYTFSKLNSENLCKFYADNFKIKTIILRPFNLYGPGQNAYFLLPKIALQLKDSSCKEISVHNLNTKRDYVYIDDFCEAIVKSTQSDLNFEIINIGSGISYSTHQIIDSLKHISGFDKTVHSLENYRKNEIMDVVADVSLANQLLNWQPNTTLNDGLQKLYQSL